MNDVKENNSSIESIIGKFKTDRELNRMNRIKRIQFYDSLSVRELKLYFTQRLTDVAYSDLVLVYNVKRRR